MLDKSEDSLPRAKIASSFELTAMEAAVLVFPVPGVPVINILGRRRLVAGLSSSIRSPMISSLYV